MTLSLLLQFTASSLAACVAVCFLVNKLCSWGLKNQQIPKFWISIIMALVCTLPNAACTLSSILQLIPTPPLSVHFAYMSLDLFFYIPLLTMLRPFNYNLSAARLEIPFLFATCTVYLLYGLEGGRFTYAKIIPMGIIFLMFCYDIMRMLELGDYKIESTAKESNTKVLVYILFYSLVYTLSLTFYTVNGNLFWGGEGHTLYEIILLTYSVLLGILPNVCIIVTWLKNNAPPELFVCNVIFGYMLTCTFLIPLQAFFIPTSCDQELIFYTLTSLLGLTVLWFQVTCLNYSNRVIATVMLTIGMIVGYKLVSI